MEMNRFHAKCVGLSEDQGRACSQRNIFWMFDECTELMGTIKFRAVVNKMRSHTKPLEIEIERLKSDAAEMREKMNTMQDHVTNKPVACVNEPTHEEEFRFSPSTSYVPLSSTRVSVNRANEGQNNDSLKLHISNVANDVTEEEVLQMINKAIGVEQVRYIKCLVPPWKDLSSLDYISFKVEIEHYYRETALKTSTWPKGVRCREFVKFGNRTWRPMRG